MSSRTIKQVVLAALFSVVAGLVLFANNTAAQEHRMVTRGKPYFPMIDTAVKEEWPSMRYPSFIPAQIEKESLWNPRAELKTSREYGFGFGQFTITSRFNAFEEVKAMSPRLRDWRYEDRFNPAMQVRAMVVKNKGNFNQCRKLMKDEQNAMYCTVAAYNGGYGGFLSDRRLCANTGGCDPGLWFGHIEHTSLKSKVKVNGYGDSFFTINRKYVANVNASREKYLPFFEGK